jgi:FeS assembly protein IscX|tara:strand:+ start:2899 stop:3093 length:195 start_codon:yes stop_codon:yes gene_type:complete
MLWTEVSEIAIELYENHPDVDPRYILFTDLHNLVINLEDFNDDPAKSNERILEAIQMNWIEELD